MLKGSWGSIVALIIGALLLLNVNRPSGMITGVLIILGTLAYRSAKVRWITGQTKAVRLGLEAVAIITFLAIWLLQNNLRKLIIEDPISLFIIPVLALAAYGFMFQKAYRARNHFKYEEEFE